MKKLSKFRKILIVVPALAVVAAGAAFFLLTRGPDPSERLVIGDQVIDFTFTDDNRGENLIIKTDQKEYSGFNESTVYFNVTNKSKEDQDVETRFYFKRNQGEVKEAFVWEDREWKKSPLDQPLEKGGTGEFARKSVGGFPAQSAFSHAIKKNKTVYFKTVIRYPPMGDGKFYMESYGSSGGYGHLDPWFASAWLFRKQITINSSQVTGDLTDFPVLVSTTDSDLADKFNSGHVGQADGGDIIFTAADGVTKLDHEIEKYTNTTGELVAWVRVPSVSSTADTGIYIYYGNADAPDQENPAGVWDSNYKSVWHLAETVTDEQTTGTHIDSTANGNNGTQNNNDDISGKMGTAQSFDGTGDYITIGDPANGSLDFGTSSFSYSVWVYVTQSAGSYDMSWWKGGSSAGYNGYDMELGTGNWASNIADGTSVKTATFSTETLSQWVYLVAVVDRSANLLRVYKNGSQVGGGTSISGFGSVSGSNSAYIGSQNGSYPFKGTIDEMRVSGTNRSADWIATEYNNQNAPGTFLTFGNEQTDEWYGTAWGYRKKLTVDAARVAGDLVNFPALVSTTDLDWRDTASSGKVGQSDGGDILFTAADGVTKLDHEIEKYTNTTGELIAWVELPALSSSVDTDFYIYYGNASVADQWNIAGTWDSDFKGVWHLNEGDSTASNFYKDATANNKDGTLTDSNGDMTSVSGKISAAVDFIGSGDDDFIDVGDSGLSNTVTLSAWVNPDTLPASQDILSERHGGLGTVDYDINSSGEIAVIEDDQGIVTSSGANIQSNIWTYVASTFSGTTVNYYVNGNFVSNSTLYSSYPNSTRSLRIGGDPSGGSTEFDGTIDEVRISAVARSANWITTEYNNQSAPAGFYTVGIEEQSGTGDNPFNNGWQYRQKITVSASQVSGDLTNFSVLVSVTDTELKYSGSGGHVAQSDGGDIFFTAADGTTKLDHEIEKYTNTTGELVAWVEVRAVSATADTDFYVYYGNSSSVDQSNTYGVWDSSYKSVWHLKETSGVTISDSTTNAVNGTINSGTAVVSGKVANARNFSATTDKISTATTAILNTDVHTIGFWANFPSAMPASWLQIIAYRPSGTDRSPGIWTNPSNNCIHWRYDPGNTGVSCGGPSGESSSFTTGTWYYVTGTKSGAGFTFYVNGTSVITPSVANPKTSGSAAIEIGQTSGFSASVFYIDELRISNVARSAAWIQTEYNNQNAPGTFLTFGAEESATWYNADWRYRKKIVLNAEQVAGDLANFPVLVNVTDADLADTSNNGHVGQSDGGDIVFTTADGRTKLDHEIEKYTNTTGELVAWVEVPQLAGSVNTYLYVYYGNASVADQWNINGTWESNYKGVWHLDEDQSGTGNLDLYQDSTSNVNHGDDYISATGQTGQIDGGNEFDGTDDYINVAHHSSLNPAGAFTISAWFNADVIAPDTNFGDTLVYKGDWNGNNSYTLVFYSGAVLRCNIGRNWGAGPSYASSNFQTGRWYFVTCLADSDGHKLYVDGKEVASNGTAPTTVTDTDIMRIGRLANSTPYSQFDGTIDEIRISAVTRSANWITTEYNNQKSPVVFASFGAEEQTPSATQIYRSVSPSKTAALATGAGNAITISGATATFASGLDNAIGVGDVIQYDADGDSTVDALAFIHGRASSTQYTVASISGGTPAAVSGDTDWSIFRAYTSLANAEAGTENTGLADALENFDTWSGGKDLTASNEVWNIAAYANGTTADTAAVNITGWTTGADNYIRIYTPTESNEVGTTQRHSGVWDANAYTLDVTPGGQWVDGIDILESYVRIEGLQVSLASTAYTDTRAIFSQAEDGEIHISNNIVKGVAGGSDADDYAGIGVYFTSANGPTLKIWNNIVYDFNAGSPSSNWQYCIYSGKAPLYMYVYNNTVYNCDRGMSGYVDNTRFKNNIVNDSYVAFDDWTGYHTDSDYNASDDATNPLPGSNSKNGTSGIVEFADEAGDDFHLADADTAARDAGIGLLGSADLAFDDDIDGEKRLGKWDIGADEVIARRTEVSASQVGRWTNGLVGYWTFDGPDMDWSQSTAEAIDRSGSGNDGNVHFGQSQVKIGKVGQALDFYVVDGYGVEIGSDVSVDNIWSGGGTISAWAYARSDGEGNGGRIADKSYNADGGSGWGFGYDNWTDSIYRFRLVRDFNGASDGEWWTNTNLPFSEWHHVAVTYDQDSASNDPIFYLDGQVWASSEINTPIGSAVSDGDRTLRLGNYLDTRTFDGLIDEVRIYDRTLSQSEIQEMYNASAESHSAKPNTPITGYLTDGLVGNWTFNGPDMDWRSDWSMVNYNSGGTQNDYAYPIAIDSTNNIYVAGYQQTNGYDWAIRKYDANGNLDTSWGSSGMVTYNSGGTQNDYAYAIAIDSSRSIYVAGNQATNGNDWAIRKYDANGNLDTSWGSSGMVTYNSGGSQSDASVAITIDSSRNIYVAGYQGTNGFDWAIRKYDANGNLDTSWGTSGMETYNSGGSLWDLAYSVTIDSSNNIYVAGRQQTNGYDWVIRKYDANGNLDTSWGSSGMVTYNSGGVQYDYAAAITIDSSRNIYVAGRQGTNGDDWAIRKYDANGNLDTSWGTSGMVTYNSGGTQNDFAYAIAIDSAQNIFVAGAQQTNGYDWAVRRYNGRGTLGTTLEALDRSGQVNHGDMSGFGQSSVRAGKVGQALSFDGSEDYVSMTGYTGILGSNERSVSMWFRTTQTTQGAAISWGTNSGSYPAEGFNIQIENGVIWSRSYGGVTGYWGSGYNDNTWHHLVLTYPQGGQNNSQNVYVDNILLSGMFNSGTTVLNTGNTNQELVKVGINANYLDLIYLYFNGLIDEVRIYNRALSPTEITELYNLGVRKFQRN